MKTRAFQQVDVFTGVPFKGNPVAVVLDGDGLRTAEMQAIARAGPTCPRRRSSADRTIPPPTIA